MTKNGTGQRTGDGPFVGRAIAGADDGRKKDIRISLYVFQGAIATGMHLKILK
jgi:hypothetical protein